MANNKRKQTEKKIEGSNSGAAKAHDKSKVQCYNCRKFVHYSKDCRNHKKARSDDTKECYNCHKKGHIKPNCPLLKGAQVAYVYEGASAPSSSAPTSSEGAGKPNVLDGTVSVKHIPVTALFDTGASRSFISSNTVKKLKLK